MLVLRGMLDWNLGARVLKFLTEISFLCVPFSQNIVMGVEHSVIDGELVPTIGEVHKGMVGMLVHSNHFSFTDSHLSSMIGAKTTVS